MEVQDINDLTLAMQNVIPAQAMVPVEYPVDNMPKEPEIQQPPKDDSLPVTSSNPYSNVDTYA